MIKRRWTVVLLIMSVVGATAAADDSEDLERFNAAYLAYQDEVVNGNLNAAVPKAKTAYEIGRRIFPENVENLAKLAFNYGWLIARVGDNEQAEEILREAVKLNEAAYGKNSLELIPSLMQLGNVTAETFDASRQRRFYNRALRITGKHHGKESTEYGRISLDAGVQILNESRSPDAKRYLENAYRILRVTLGDEDATTGLAAFHLGRFQISRARYRHSEKYFLSALSTFENPDRRSSPIEMSAHAWLVAVYEEIGESDKATAHCQAIGRMTPMDGDQEYLPLYKKAPRYPSAALSQGREGFTILRFTVDQEGRAKDPEVVEVSGGRAFVGPSLEAIRQFRYAPQFFEGKPVSTSDVMQKITFRIAN